MSIPKPLKKINIIALIAICVVLGIMFATGSFKLGSISRVREPVKILPPTLDFSAQQRAKIDYRGPVVGSKSGSRYHLADCPGAKTILAANLITFASPEEAQRAGYSPAANCPALK